MSIAIREPWGLLSRFSREFDAVAGVPSNKVSFIPAVDVREDKDQYVVQADLPGVKPEDVEVTAEKGILTVRGERKTEQREGAEGYARIERVAGNFSRRFVLPETRRPMRSRRNSPMACWRFRSPSRPWCRRLA